MGGRTAVGEGEVRDTGATGTDHLPRRRRPLSPDNFDEERGAGTHLSAFLEACDAADWLRSAGGGVLPRYAANVALGRTLASRIDELQAHGFVRADGKADTTTASQYLKCLEALRLTPAAEAKGAAAARGKGGADTSLDDFRRRSFRAVGR